MIKRFIGIGAIALALFVIFGWNGSLLGTDVTIERYALSGTTFNWIFVSVPFDGSSDEALYLQASLDWNRDGEFGEDEWAVQGAPVLLQKGGLNRFEVEVPDGTVFGETVSVQLALTTTEFLSWADETEETIVVEAPFSAFDLQEVWDLDTPGSNQDLKRGFFVNTTFAAEPVEATREGEVPDLSGGPMDCFPISTANNLISLAEHNGRRGDLPADPKEMIDELKRDMQFENGVLTRNFMPGKAAFVERYGLPVTTESVARPTFQQIADALAEGAAVELSMAHLRSATGRPDAGHVVTPVAAVGDGGQMGLFVHDPVTPEGADFREITAPPAGNTFWRLDYGFWDGVTVIDYMYIQRWNTEAGSTPESSVAPQSSSSDSMAAGDIQVESLVIDGKFYPLSQFFNAAPDVCPDPCDGDHYHSNGSVAYATDLTSKADSGDCGFGKVSEAQIETISLSAGEHAELMQLIGQ